MRLYLHQFQFKFWNWNGCFDFQLQCNWHSEPLGTLNCIFCIFPSQMLSLQSNESLSDLQITQWARGTIQPRGRVYSVITSSGSCRGLTVRDIGLDLCWRLKESPKLSSSDCWLCVFVHCTVLLACLHVHIYWSPHNTYICMQVFWPSWTSKTRWLNYVMEISFKICIRWILKYESKIKEMKLREFCSCCVASFYSTV